MVRRIKVFAVLLFASCLFCFSTYAEFTSSDSSNLSSIERDVSDIQSSVSVYLDNLSELGLIRSLLNTISTNIIDYLDPTRYTSFAGQAISKLDSLNSSVSQINSFVSQILGKLGVNTSLNVYHEFQNSKNFMDAWTTGNYSIIGNALVPVFSGDWISPRRNNDNVFIAPGTYAVSVQTNVNWFFNGADSWVTNNGTVYITFNNMSQPLFKVSAQPSWFVVDIYPADSNQQGEMAGASVDSAINNSNSNLSGGINQLEGLEDQVFGSLDTSLGSIDFSGSALGQVVSGFNFIRAVFSAVYSSSPYISVLINLSCMFGVLALFLRVQPRFSRWEREHRDRSS